MSMNLSEFRLIRRNRQTRAIKDNESGACRALVNGADKLVLQIIVARILILDDRSISVMGGRFVDHGLSTSMRSHGREKYLYL